jgi:hypothetical protein
MLDRVRLLTDSRNQPLTRWSSPRESQLSERQATADQKDGCWRIRRMDSGAELGWAEQTSVLSAKPPRTDPVRTRD